FVGILCHGLRTPLSTLFGCSALRNDPPRKIPEEAKTDLIQNLDRESERLVRLVENLLLLARAELGKRPESERFSVLELVDNIAASTRAQNPKRDVRVENRLTSEEIFSERT